MNAKKIIDELSESWVGNVLIPTLQDIADSGGNVLTRAKAMDALDAYNDKTSKSVYKWLDSIDDKDYYKFYHMWLK